MLSSNCECWLYFISFHFVSFELESVQGTTDEKPIYFSGYSTFVHLTHWPINQINICTDKYFHFVRPHFFLLVPLFHTISLSSRFLLVVFWNANEQTISSNFYLIRQYSGILHKATDMKQGVVAFSEYNSSANTLKSKCFDPNRYTCISYLLSLCWSNSKKLPFITMFSEVFTVKKCICQCSSTLIFCCWCG